MSNYFTADEAEMFVFYRIPQALFTNPKYSKLNSDSKILYGLLLDRNSLSIRNNWIDDRGYIYIYFSREEAMERIGLCDKSTTKAFKQLKEVDLIEEIRHGQGKANTIFVKKFIATSGINNKNRKKYDSKTVKNTIQEPNILRANNTYSSYTYGVRQQQQENLETLEIQDNSHSKNNVVVVSPVIDQFLRDFKTLYNADFDKNIAQSLIDKKGIQVINDYLKAYKDYVKGRKILNIAGDFYTFVTRGYEKPVKANNKVKPTYANFDQREYPEEYYEQFYANKDE